MAQFLHELGSEAESNISGFKGVITSRSEHLNGCNRYWVSPKVTKDGKLPDGYWFDEGELIIIKAPVLKQQNQDRGGFPSSLK
jgi:hypothetical protein